MSLTTVMGAQKIALERKRQVDLGHTAEKDQHDGVKVLYLAATAYMTNNEKFWPWAKEEFKPTGTIANPSVQDLAKAGALIAAAIDYHTNKG